MRSPAGALGTPMSRRYRATAGFRREITRPWENIWAQDEGRRHRPGTLRAARVELRGRVRGAAGSPERRPAKPGRRMIARRRRVDVLESDVPEYLVDNALFGDERDDSHGPPAAGTQQRIFLPNLPNELRPSYAPASAPFAFIAVGVIGRACRCLVSAV